MRADRLLSILLLLQNRHRMTARELAGELEVSMRTVYRDVEALAAAGVPVYAEQGRTGGYRLVDGYRTRLTGLTEQEAASLFLLGMPGPAAAFGMSREVVAVELKLLAALAPNQRMRAGRLKGRFHLDMPAWYHEAEEPPYLAEVADAVLRERRIEVVYRRWAEPREVRRVLEPYGLVLKGGIWYLVAVRSDGSRSGGVSSARAYRVSNILRLTPTDQGFDRPGGFDLAEHWRRYLEEFDGRRLTGTAVVRLSESLRARLPDLSDPALVRAVADTDARPDEAGRLTVELPIESVDNAAGRLIGYGADLEVIHPVELCERLAAMAGSLLALYAPKGASTGTPDDGSLASVSEWAEIADIGCQ